jgi:diaminopimelate decarboxylase
MAFTYENKRLSLEGVDLSHIAEQFGTPAYVYSESILNRNARVMAEAFVDRGIHVSYAVKANPNPHILKLLRSFGFGVDIVSGGELRMAQHVGFSGKEINFAGVGKTYSEIEQALNAGIAHFNVESLYELEALQKHAELLGKKASVLLRLNPDIDPQTHPHISTGLKNNKFGMAPELVSHTLQQPAEFPNLIFDGIHCHIGSQILKPQPFYDLIDYLHVFAAEQRKHGVEIRHMDLGGGFGVNYQDPFEDILETTPYLEVFAERASKKLGDHQLHIQPGRVLVANSAVLLCQVIGSKDNGGHHFIVSDGATTDLIRPALYDAYHAVYPHLEKPSSRMADLVGPVCESSDALAKGRELPDFKAGELLVVASAGAYGSAMGSTYNLRPLSPEILVTENGELRSIRRRQKFEEMISLY